MSQWTRIVIVCIIADLCLSSYTHTDGDHQPPTPVPPVDWHRQVRLVEWQESMPLVGYRWATTGDLYTAIPGSFAVPPLGTDEAVTEGGIDFYNNLDVSGEYMLAFATHHGHVILVDEVGDPVTIDVVDGNTVEVSIPANLTRELENSGVPILGIAISFCSWDHFHDGRPSDCSVCGLAALDPTSDCTLCHDVRLSPQTQCMSCINASNCPACVGRDIVGGFDSDSCTRCQFTGKTGDDLCSLYLALAIGLPLVLLSVLISCLFRYRNAVSNWIERGAAVAGRHEPFHERAHAQQTRAANTAAPPQPGEDTTPYGGAQRLRITTSASDNNLDASGPSSPTLIPEEHQCPVCFGFASRMLAPCMHRICHRCVVQLRVRQCPLCRMPYEGAIEIQLTIPPRHREPEHMEQEEG